VRADRREAPCPCGTGLPYDDCCGPLHRGQTQAGTAERLMRARFSAFAVGDTGYLLRTWHAAERPKTLPLDPRLRWVRLEIVGHTGGGLLATEGTVEFVAHWRQGARSGTQREHSRFVRQEGRWLYVGPLPQS
jgi:SEC-C motif-containing protein